MRVSTWTWLIPPYSSVTVFMPGAALVSLEMGRSSDKRLHFANGCRGTIAFLDITTVYGKWRMYDFVDL
jgi:hypothetical protein